MRSHQQSQTPQPKTEETQNPSARMSGFVGLLQPCSFSPPSRGAFPSRHEEQPPPPVQEEMQSKHYSPVLHLSRALSACPRLALWSRHGQRQSQVRPCWQGRTTRQQHLPPLQKMKGPQGPRVPFCVSSREEPLGSQAQPFCLRQQSALRPYRSLYCCRRLPCAFDPSRSQHPRHPLACSLTSVHVASGRPSLCLQRLPRPLVPLLTAFQLQDWILQVALCSLHCHQTSSAGHRP